MLRITRSLVVPTYGVGVLGAFLQISGGTWDVSSHILGIPDTFFTTSHLILYAGVGLSLLAGVSGLFLRGIFFRGSGTERALLTGLRISLVGGVLQLVAGPFDLWWHDQFGFDPHLFTPSHSLLIAGIVLTGVGMAVGSVRLLFASRTGMSLGRIWSDRVFQTLTIASMAALWLDLNGLVYLVTDVDGMDYTFHLGANFVQQASQVSFFVTPILLALTGTLVFLASKKSLGWTGASTLVTVIVGLVIATANLGFRAWFLMSSPNPQSVAQGNTISMFLPVYLLFLVPVFAIDLLVGNNAKTRWGVIAAALVAPFASFLDGFYSLILWTTFGQFVLVLVVPMLVAGVVAGLSRARFTLFLASKPMMAAYSPRVAE